MAKFSPGELVATVRLLSGKKNRKYYSIMTYQLPDTNKEKVWRYGDPVRPGIVGIIVTKVVDEKNDIFYDVLFSDRLRVSRIHEKYLEGLGNETTRTSSW